jgi:hypothetical protein
MNVNDLKILVDDIIRTQDEIVYQHWQTLAEIEINSWREDLNDPEIQEDFRTMRYEYQWEAGYLEALKLIQEKLKEL